MFYYLGDNEAQDQGVFELFEKNGFIVKSEDIGARKSIFDKYNTIEHFQRVEEFRSTFVEIIGTDQYVTDNVIYALEELHPKIFDVFAAASKTFARSETAEDLAQASLSGRRVLEQLADYLFPPSDILLNGRKVGKAEYRNRIWAYIVEALNSEENDDKSVLEKLGKEADDLVELFNSGLHSEPTKLKVQSAFKRLVFWIQDLILISPESARRPYLAYENELKK